MKGIILMTDFVEDTESLTTVDVLRRANLVVDLVSITDKLTIKTQSNITIQLDKTLSEVVVEEYDFLIIPGGKAVFNYLDNSREVSHIIKYFIEANKLSAYICAASHLPGKLGYLKGKNYTCFPGCNSQIIGGKYLGSEHLVIDGNIITCRSMAYSIDFALAIIEKLVGKNQKDKTEKSIRGLV